MSEIIIITDPIGGSTTTLRCKGLNSAGALYSTVLGGMGNTVGGDSSTIVGGRCNLTSGKYSFISGGFNNFSQSDITVIGGGCYNILNENSVGSIIGGGFSNQITGSQSIIGGGNENIIFGDNSTLTNGNLNNISGSTSTISGGKLNTINGTNSTIGGGTNNTINSNNSIIVAGTNNLVNDDSSVIVGGLSNLSESKYNTILNGYGNRVSGDMSSIINGRENTISGEDSFIGGGLTNNLSGDYSIINGGINNNNLSNQSFIGGGSNNNISGDASVINGGLNNTSTLEYTSISGGRFNTSMGVGSTIGGGLYNTVFGSNSFSYGYNNTVSGESSYVLSKNSILIANNSAIIGGQNIIGDTDDTLYVNNLNLFNPKSSINNPFATPNTNLFPLGIDSDGFVGVFSFSNTDTVITGATYDNTLGELTLDNSNGYKIYVTGFTTNDSPCFTNIPTGNTGYTLSVDTNGCLLLTTGKTITPRIDVVKGEFTDYVKTSRLTSFSGLSINDTDEGPVYFGSTSGITVDVSNGRIGIGTTTPSESLDVVGNVLVSGNLEVTGDTQLGGSLMYNTISVDAIADPNLTPDVNVVFYSASSPGGTIYLPAARQGKEVVLIRVIHTNSASVLGTGGANINGVGIAQALPTTLYTKTTFISDGTDWYANNVTPF